MTEQQRYFLGVLGFAFVVVWAALGVVDAVLATVACLAALNANRLASFRTPRPRVTSSPRTRAVHARALQDENEPPHRLVPDEPSLVISTS